MPGLTEGRSGQLAPGFSSECYSWEHLRSTLSDPLEFNRVVELHLVRHGETVTNAQSLVTGSRDVPLTDLGREQARHIGHHLDRRYDAAFHSTLSRSRDTLHLALQAGGVTVGSIFPDWRLNERT